MLKHSQKKKKKTGTLAQAYKGRTVETSFAFRWKSKENK